MSATNFKTENNTYRKLIGNGLTYQIPRFQRDYSWTDEEWEELWSDILGTIQEGANQRITWVIWSCSFKMKKTLM